MRHICRNVKKKKKRNKKQGEQKRGNKKLESFGEEKLLGILGSVHSSCYGDEDIFFKILKWLFFFRCEGASAVLQC